MSDAAPRTGAEIFETPKLSVDKLPQLRGVFERLAVSAVENFRELSPTPVTYFLNQVNTGESWDILDAYEDCMAAVYYVVEWDAYALIALDRRMIFSTIDAVFGGDGSEPLLESTRTYSSLEVQIAKIIFESTAASLRTALAPLMDVSFTLERIENQIEFTILGSKNIPSVFAQLLFQIFDHGGRMLVLIPQAPLYPIRRKLARGAVREQHSEDPRWSHHMRSRVASTHVSSRAMVEGPTLTLDEIAHLRVGQVLQLDPSAGSNVTLECAGTNLFNCSLGQFDGNLCVKVNNSIDASKSLIDGILGEAMKNWNGKH